MSTKKIMKVYGDLKSGNCYKIKLLLDLLRQPHEWMHVDVMAGDTRTDLFRQINPNGKIPVLEIEDGTYLSESNAILDYLAEGSEYMPSDPLGRAQVLQWQFFEQYSHEPYIAVARFIVAYLGNPDSEQLRLEATRGPGYKALDVMERQLSKNKYLVGMEFSVADISLYAYTHVCEEGGFSLANYPAIQSWIARVEREPGFKTLHAYLNAQGQ